MADEEEDSVTQESASKGKNARQRRFSKIPVRSRTQLLGDLGPQSLRNETVRRNSSFGSRSSIPVWRMSLSGGKNLVEYKFSFSRFKCGLCSNLLDDPRVLNCLHYFCYDCLLSTAECEKKQRIASVSVAREDRDLTEECLQLSRSESTATTRFSSNISRDSSTKDIKLDRFQMSTLPIRSFFSARRKSRTAQVNELAPSEGSL